MIFNQDSKVVDHSDWHSYFSDEVVTRLNMAANGVFVVAGQQAEPQRNWNAEKKQYDDTVVAYGYWLTQNFVDKKTGQIYCQNPVLVVVDGPEVQLKFGQHVKLSGLLGYYSRRRRSYSFRADEVKAVPGND